MSPTTCPHGLDPATCEICRVLRPTPVRPGRVPVGSRSAAGRRRGLPSVAGVVVAAIVAVVVVGWVAAAVFAVLRILELVAVAAGAGWVGYGVGVRRGSRGRR